ncbi:MAG: RluA family pseudouridine synthase [Solirubrobacteraceae bacterium]
MSSGPLRLQVSEGDAGARLDRFLAEPVGSRARAQHLIEAGQVRVDGRACPKRHLLAAGEFVEVFEVEPAGVADDAPTSPAPFTVAYQDRHLLVIDKPAGVVVHPGRGHREGTLSQALAAAGAAGGDPGRAGIVHRLDRDTSGLLVVARSDDVHRALSRLLARRGITREYLALVSGRPSARTGTVDAPIGRARRDRVLHSTDTDAPREARTHFEVRLALARATLLSVVLETGRTHQIRVHMAAIGHPVCGDRQYGTGGEYDLTRQFLHAARLAFEHPVTGVAVEASSPLPDDLCAALARAREAH